MHYQLSSSTHQQSRIGITSQSGGSLADRLWQGFEHIDPRPQAASALLHPMALHVDAEV